MTLEPYYDHGGIQIFHGDCREILPQLDVASVDLVLTDPPYGINNSEFRNSLPDTKGSVDIRPITGDDSEAMAIWLMDAVSSLPMVVWGANNWPYLLPHRGRWICWDKRCDERADKMLGSPFELAWENKLTGFGQMIRLQHGGVVNADHKRFCRSHPTQKPVGLFMAILRRYADAMLILDPFMGSGTTLRAAKDLGRKAIGIEIEERYAEIAASRLRQEVLF